MSIDFSIRQTFNPVPIEVTVSDPDGSESFFLFIAEDTVPNGTVICTLSGNITAMNISSFAGTENLAPNGLFYVLTPEDLDGTNGKFDLLPPLHYSSALQGDILLQTFTVVTDDPGDVAPDIRDPEPFNITIDVEGVADPPEARSIIINGTEDEFYDFGSVLGDLEGVVVDVSTYILWPP